MGSVPKDILLIGLGAVGTIYAFVLQKAGLARVTVIARSNFEVVKENGVHIKSAKYGEYKRWRPYRVFRSVEEAADRAYTHVVLLTKLVPEVQTNPQLLTPLLSAPYTDRFPQPVYVLMQNGMYIEVDLWKAIKALGQGKPKIIGTSVYIGSKQLDKGVVQHSDFDRVSLGIHRDEVNVLTNTPEEEAILAGFGDILAKGGTQVTIVPEIHRVKYRKNALNCLFGPACALARYSMQEIFRKPLDEEALTANGSVIDDTTTVHKATADVPASFPKVAEITIPWMYDILEEVKELGQKLFPATDSDPGVDPDLSKSVLMSTAVIVIKPTSSERPSMLVDVEMGRPTETDVIIGSVIRKAKQVGVSMPRLESMYALMVVVQENLLYEYRKRDRA